MTSILYLPDELLLEVASNMTDKKDLGSLSLVSSHFRGMAQETLFHSISAPLTHIHDLLSITLDGPVRAQQIHSVVILDTTKQDSEQTEEKDEGRTISEQVIKKGLAIIRSHKVENNVAAQWESDFKGGLANANLAVLLLSLQNMTGLEVPRELAAYFPINGYCGSESRLARNSYPYLTSVISSLSGKLDRLSVRPTDSQKSTMKINFESFTRLSSLSIPMSMINASPAIPNFTISISTFPPNIRHLKITECSDRTSRLLNQLADSIQQEGPFTNAVMIELAFSDRASTIEHPRSIALGRQACEMVGVKFEITCGITEEWQWCMNIINTSDELRRFYQRREEKALAKLWK